MNKLTKIIVGSVLALGVIAATYWAAIEYVLKDYQNMAYIVFSYTYSDTGKPREVTINRVNYNSDYPANFEVPEKLLGYPVTTIGPGAFGGLERLKTVTLPKTITHIGDGAFQECPELTEVKSKSKKISEIGVDIFKNSPNWIGYKQQGLVVLDSILYMFNGNIAEGTVIKGEENRTAADGSNTIYIGSDISGIAGGAFANQPGITSFSLPSRFTEINNSLLKNCVNLKRVEMEQIQQIGNDAFNGCTSLEEVVLNPDIIEEIGNYAFKETDLKSFEFSQKITSINAGVFQGCEKLESVEIPSSITSIGSDAFNGCIALTTIEKTVPGDVLNDLSNITTIGERAFQSTKLKSLTIPSRVKAIQKDTFLNCTELVSVILPEVKVEVDENGNTVLDPYGRTSYTGIEVIGDNAFKNTVKLQGIEFPTKAVTVDGVDAVINTLSGIGSYAFENSGIKSIIVPASISVEISTGVFKDCKELETVVLQEGINYIPVGTSDKHEPTTTVQYHTIRASVFEGTTKLKEVIIPNQVRAIFDSVFKNSSVNKVKLPVDNPAFVTINDSLFENCVNLDDVFIPTTVTTIKTKAFANCLALDELFVPKRVSIIDPYAFLGCSETFTLNIEHQTAPSGWKTGWDVRVTEPEAKVITNWGVVL